MRRVVWILIAALIVLHHDFWWWTDGTLLGGAIPIGLAYHMGLSVAASLVWLLTVRFAWPQIAAIPAAESRPEKPVAHSTTPR
ncbi:MAG: DUF3311 domain-containing protein [Planctomycetota bacterium]|nr:MAG: DUF3311 domain-containing protein [Planctomycetota bacterium]